MMIVYETVYSSLTDYVCMLFWNRQIPFQLVIALIVVFPQCVHTFTWDGLSQYNTEEFKIWACFFYAVIEFGFVVYFIISGKEIVYNWVSC
jgi:hypothetical protein